MLNKTFKMPAQLAAELMLTAKAGAAPPGPKKWVPGRKLLSFKREGILNGSFLIY